EFTADTTCIEYVPGTLMLKISAKTIESFRRICKRIAVFLDAKDETALVGILYTLNIGRSDHKFKFCFTGANKEILLTQLHLAATEDFIPVVVEDKEVVLLLSANPLPVETSKWLYQHNDNFRLKKDIIWPFLDEHHALSNVCAEYYALYHV